MRFSKFEIVLLGTILSMALVLGLLSDFSDLLGREIEEESEAREAKRLETENVSREDMDLAVCNQGMDCRQANLLYALYLTSMPKKMHVSAGLSGKAFSHSPPWQG